MKKRFFALFLTMALLLPAVLPVWKQKVIWCESLTPMINAASFCLLRKRRKN